MEGTFVSKTAKVRINYCGSFLADGSNALFNKICKLTTDILTDKNKNT
jgi:hypothetical protein